MSSVVKQWSAALFIAHISLVCIGQHLWSVLCVTEVNVRWCHLAHINILTSGHILALIPALCFLGEAIILSSLVLERWRFDGISVSISYNSSTLAVRVKINMITRPIIIVCCSSGLFVMAHIIRQEHQWLYFITEIFRVIKPSSTSHFKWAPRTKISAQSDR